MGESITPLHCQVCQREVSEMFVCPQREVGTCPYTYQRPPRRQITLRGLEGVFGGIAVVVLYIIVDSVLDGLNFSKLGFLLLNGAIILITVFFFAFLYALFVNQEELNDLKAGTSIKHQTIRGYEITQTVMKRPVQIALKQPASPLDQPASVLARYHRFNAPYVFSATLLHLVASQKVQLWEVEGYRVFLGRVRPVSEESRYLLSLDPGARIVHGVLEKRILSLLSVREVAPLKGFKELAREIFQEDVKDPYGILLDWVQEDAVKRGLATSSGFKTSLQTSLDPHDVTMVVEQFKQTYPEMVQILNEQAAEGIGSRKLRSESWDWD